MIRTFIAVEFTPELRAALEKAQAEVKSQVMKELRYEAPDARIQWVRPESMHLTLKFLGGTSEDTVKDIEEAMRRVATGRSAFSLSVDGLGVFPDRRAPRVLWVGLSGHVEDLVRLAGDLDRAVQDVGFAAETKPFRPHLTLARIKDRGREVGRALTRSGLMDRIGTMGSLSVSAISLMKSDLKPSGAVYQRLVEVELGQ